MVAEIQNVCNEEENKDDVLQEENFPTAKQSREALTIIRKTLEHRGASEKVYGLFYDLEMDVRKLITDSLAQTRLDKFFCCSSVIDYGGAPSALDCFLVCRGLQTLSLRMDQHQKNALSIAKFLEGHPAVERVFYPGLKSHPQHELAKRQCSGFSGMVSFYIKGKLPEAKKIVTSLKVIIFAGSLGDLNSLVQIPTLLAQKEVPEDIKARMEITENLIRLSVGLESVEDLINDLDQALKRIIP